MLKYIINQVNIIPLFEGIADIGTLKKVVDRDTLHFNNAKCRIAYIDTPESKRNKKAKRDTDRCKNFTLDTMVKIGKASADHAKTLVKVGKQYKYDVIGTDRYKRAICIVHTPNGISNELMVKDGYAMPYVRYLPDTLKRKYFLHVKSAKASKHGLWHKYNIECIGKD